MPDKKPDKKPTITVTLGDKYHAFVIAEASKPNVRRTPSMWLTLYIEECLDPLMDPEDAATQSN